MKHQNCTPHVRLLDFLADYSRTLLGAGVHISRVIRNARRIAESQGGELTVFSTMRVLILSLDAPDGDIISKVVPVPDSAISFELNTNLSSLSWQALDQKLSLGEIEARYKDILSRPRMNPWLVMVLVALANASFCRLFGGDLIAMGVVCLSTAVGYSLKILMGRLKCNVYLTFTVCSFIASAIAATSVWLPCNSAVAIATSPLFLVPGVPLINGVMDILERHVLTGVSRLANAVMLICCMAVGLACTILIMHNSLL